MPFINFSDKPKIRIWDGISGSIAHSGQVTFGHFTLEKGIVLPEHNHIHEQWTHLVEGELEFTIDGETELLVPGSTAHIPSNAPHSAKAITECRVIDCFLPVREDFMELEREQTGEGRPQDQQMD